ncbi:MAG TPA: AsmA-like C-terminal region-containing protein [Vicinamibacterales bacterium]|nr:AsmA-like C-terminal region-containing protein [Vicinamibacterales bacterium]
MRKAVRLVVYLVIVLVALLAAAAVAMYVLLSGDSIKNAIEAQATAALGRPVHIATARPRIFPRASIDLGDVTVGEAREVTIGRVLVSTGLAALIHRRVEEATVTIENSTIDVRWAIALLAAMGNGRAAVPHAPGSAPLVIDSIGRIALRNVTLLAGGRQFAADMDASLTGGDRFVVTRLTGRSDVSNFTASGEISSLSARRGSFTVDAESIDLDGLLAFLVAATPAGAGAAGGAPPATGAASGPPIEIDVGVRAAKGRALGLAFTDLNTAAKIRGSDVRLDDLRLNLLGGHYAGAAAFRGSDPRSGRYEWRGSFQGIDMPQLVAFAGYPEAMTGKLSGTVALAAAGVDAQQALRNARGSAALTIADGRVPGLEIVRSVILAFGKPTGEHPGGSGEAFTRLSATLAISGLETATKDLVFASRDLDMRGAGRLSLAAGSVDFRTDVILSRELSAQAGRDLYRLAREGDRIVLPARITGTVSKPTVFIDVQAALGRALRNRAEDELKNLFDRLRKK